MPDYHEPRSRDERLLNTNVYKAEVVETNIPKNYVDFMVIADKKGLVEFLVVWYLKIITEYSRLRGFQKDFLETLTSVEEQLRTKIDSLIDFESGMSPYFVRIYINTVQPDQMYRVRFYDNTRMFDEDGGIQKIMPRLLSKTQS